MLGRKPAGEVVGVKVTGTWRSHQVPLSGVRESPEHLRLLEAWLRSYHPDDLFDERGAPVDLVLAANVAGDLRMSASLHANGGCCDASWTYPTSVTSPSP